MAAETPEERKARIAALREAAQLAAAGREAAQQQRRGEDDDDEEEDEEGQEEEQAGAAPPQEDGSEDGGGDAVDEDDQRQLRFRNYQPKGVQGVQASRVPFPSIPEFHAPAAAPDNAAADNAAADNPQAIQLSRSCSTDEYQSVLCVQDALVSLAPKKPNWDLKRDVAQKLEKLERRTQRAMIALMREEEERRAAEAEGVEA
eukprot:jgi/Chlat1/577/Chrsp103S01007